MSRYTYSEDDFPAPDIMPPFTPILQEFDSFVHINYNDTIRHLFEWSDNQLLAYNYHEYKPFHYSRHALYSYTPAGQLNSVSSFVKSTQGIQLTNPDSFFYDGNYH